MDLMNIQELEPKVRRHNISVEIVVLRLIGLLKFMKTVFCLDLRIEMNITKESCQKPVHYTTTT
jgi:hypothetical protein